MAVLRNQMTKSSPGTLSPGPQLRLSYSLNTKESIRDWYRYRLFGVQEVALLSQYECKAQALK